MPKAGKKSRDILRGGEKMTRDLQRQPTLFIDNLPLKINSRDRHSFFSKEGKIEYACVPYIQMRGTNRRFGFIKVQSSVQGENNINGK